LGNVGQVVNDDVGTGKLLWLHKSVRLHVMPR
jgi:hypothetical protein